MNEEINEKDFNWVWKDSTKEEILKQFYFEHIDLRKTYKETERLNSNWNELEEWLKDKYKEYSRNDKNHIDVAMSGTLYAVLDKMKEIKENNE